MIAFIKIVAAIWILQIIWFICEYMRFEHKEARRREELREWRK